MGSAPEPILVEGHVLWPDGTISVPPAEIMRYVQLVKDPTKLFVTELSADIVAFNRVADHPLRIKDSIHQAPLAWCVPEKYKYLDLDAYLVGLVKRIKQDELYQSRVERLAAEIWLFKEMRLDDVLRVLIYVIDTMREKNVVWGVGRGSSCSSYLLYLLGLHEVDVVRYEIAISDFIRPGG